METEEIRRQNRSSLLLITGVPIALLILITGSVIFTVVALKSGLTVGLTYLITFVVPLLLATFISLIRAAGELPGATGEEIDITSQAPEIVELVRSVAYSTGHPYPDRILLTDRANASAGFRRRAIFRNSGQLELRIGVPLLATMSVAHLKSIVAHELGHFQNNDPSVTSAHRFVSYWTDILISNLNAAAPYSMLKFVEKFQLRLLSERLRGREILADQATLVVVPLAVAVEALEIAIRADRSWKDFTERYLGDEPQRRTPATGVFSCFTRYYWQVSSRWPPTSGAGPRGKSTSGSHPSNEERVTALRVLASQNYYSPHDVDDRPAWHLFWRFLQSSEGDRLFTPAAAGVNRVDMFSIARDARIAEAARLAQPAIIAMRSFFPNQQLLLGHLKSVLADEQFFRNLAEAARRPQSSVVAMKPLSRQLAAAVYLTLRDSLRADLIDDWFDAVEDSPERVMLLLAEGKIVSQSDLMRLLDSYGLDDSVALSSPVNNDFRDWRKVTVKQNAMTVRLNNCSYDLFHLDDRIVFWPRPWQVPLSDLLINRLNRRWHKILEGENSERFFDIHLSGIWHMEDAKSGGTGFDIQLRNGFRLGVVDVMFLGWWTPSPSRSATKAGHEWHKEALKLLRVTADRYPIVTEGSLGVAPPETPVGLRFLETRRRADSVIQLSLMCFLVALAISIYSLFEDEFWLLYWALLPVALGLIFGAAASAYIRTSKRSLARFPFVSAKSVKRYYWWTGVVVFLGIFGCGFGALALPKALIESRRAAASKAPALAAFVIPVVAWLTWFAVT